MFRMVLPFGGTIVAPAQSVTNNVAPWYLSGGVSAANCVAAYKAKGAASLAASYINLANPGTYDAAAGVAPTWNATDGWIFTGTQYLKTGIIPADLTWTVLMQYTGLVATEYTVPFGSQTSATQGWLIQVGVGAAGMRSQNGKIAQNNPFLSDGNYGIAGLVPYRNGIAEATTIDTGGTATNVESYIGAANAGGAAVHAQVKIIALVIYASTLNGTQVLAVKNAMAAL